RSCTSASASTPGSRPTRDLRAANARRARADRPSVRRCSCAVQARATRSVCPKRPARSSTAAAATATSLTPGRRSSVSADGDLILSDQPRQPDRQAIPQCALMGWPGPGDLYDEDNAMTDTEYAKLARTCAEDLGRGYRALSRLQARLDADPALVNWLVEHA